MGLVINRSGALKPGDYLIPSKGDEQGPAAIVIRGNHLTVDLQRVVLRGTPGNVDPDKRKGVGIEVVGNDVTLKNATVRGYKIGLIARNARNLKVLNGDFSYNWKQHLLSTPERENESDWQSYHHNEKDEWLGYGAGIYLRNCDGFEVRGTRVVGGQCGLMLTDCDRGLAWNNDLSFNSGLGIGMYRSSDNRIMHNKVDWDVRGFSYGVYNRGQDSAGILVFEQCMRNVFAYNSVTHGGDGFFLWAGQTTMDTGKGGCNDNLLYGNDFSHAPTNGIEATFSRNSFVNNLVLECWHGVWGGYSYDTKIDGNVFGFNSEAIAIEHGQNNSILGNSFYRDAIDINLWSSPTQDPNWGYGKVRDTKSLGYGISGNLFAQTNPGPVLRAKATSDLNVGPNNYAVVGALYDVRGPLTNFRFAGGAGAKPVSVDKLGTGWEPSVEGTETAKGSVAGNLLPQASSLTAGRSPIDAREYASRFATNWNPLRNPVGARIILNGATLAQASVQALAPKPLKGGQDPFLKPGTLRGWRYMIVDEWGPYDFRRPLLWAREQTGDTRRFEILGPKGSWKAVNVKGVKLSAQSGSVPGFVDVTFDASRASNVDIDLQYVGARTVDYRGIVTPAGRPVRFGYTRFFAPIDWSVRIFPWTKSTDPGDPHAVPDPDEFKQDIAGKPVAETKANKLDFMTGGPFLPGAPADHFLTVADGTFDIDPGTYNLEVTMDDGARVWVDGKLLIDQWHYQGPTPYSVALRLGGRHKIHIEHFEIDGYAALQVTLKPAK